MISNTIFINFSVAKMEQNEEIEIQLWEYIDGTCNDNDRQRISTLIEQKAVWKAKYAELLAFNADISSNLELEQPAMRFTQNVMDAVAAQQIAPATKKYINKSLIRGIAAFFITMLASIFGYALATSHGHTGPGMLPKIDFGNLNYTHYINSSTMKVFISVNIVIGLVFLDTMLRRKRTQEIH